MGIGVKIFLVFLYTLFTIDIFFRENILLRYSNLIFFIFFFTYILLKNNVRVFLPKLNSKNIIYYFFILLLIISIFRSGLPSHSSYRIIPIFILWLITLLFINLILIHYSKKDQFEKVLNYVFLSPSLYIILNLFLYLVGVQNPLNLYAAIAESKMALLFGINTERVLFPISSGINHFGVITGLSLTILLLYKKYYLEYKYKKLLVYGLIILNLIVLILADSKTALIMPFFVYVLIHLLENFGQLQKIKWLPFLLPFMPVLLLLSLQLISNTELANLISRRPGDIESATGRNIIWGFLVSGLSNFDFSDIIGYGQYGHVTYGITEKWQYFFSNSTDTKTMSGHNMSLQLIYDIGYLGFMIFMFLNYHMLNILIKLKHIYRINYVLIGSIIYLLVIGTTESSISLYFKENLILYMFIVVYCMILSTKNNANYRCHT